MHMAGTSRLGVTVAESVYVDEAWNEEEKFYDLMVETGWMDAGTEIPHFEAVLPPS